MTYDAWKTTPPADDEPDVEACGHRVGTCEGECKLDTEPAPALDECSEGANVSAFLELADWVGRKAFSPGDRYTDAAAALRSYAELVSALLYLDRHNYGVRHLPSKDVTFDLDHESVIEAAREEGWPGLEEA